MKNTHKVTKNKWNNKEFEVSEAHVRKVSSKREQAIENTLGLQVISIRLQKTLIEALKQLAKEDGIGYQPYIRRLLTQYVRNIKRDHLKAVNH